MNATALFTGPDVDYATLKAANQRHDAQKHHVSMWQRAKYNGAFGYPGAEKRRRRQIRRSVDRFGNIVAELVENGTAVR